MAELKQLRMLTTGPNKNYKIGALVSVDAARALLLVRGKHAKEVKHGDSVRIQEHQDI